MYVVHLHNVYVCSTYMHMWCVRIQPGSTGTYHSLYKGEIITITDDDNNRTRGAIKKHRDTTQPAVRTFIHSLSYIRMHHLSVLQSFQCMYVCTSISYLNHNNSAVCDTLRHYNNKYSEKSLIWDLISSRSHQKYSSAQYYFIIHWTLTYKRNILGLRGRQCTWYSQYHHSRVLWQYYYHQHISPYFSTCWHIFGWNYYLSTHWICNSQAFFFIAPRLSRLGACHHTQVIIRYWEMMKILFVDNC